MLNKILDSINSLFRALDAMRLLPTQTTFRPDINIFSISSLSIVALLFVLARQIVVPSGYTATVILAAVAILLFFLSGLCVRFFAKAVDPEAETNRIAEWLFLYWIICIVVLDLTDVPLVLSGNSPVGYYIFDWFLNFPVSMTNPLRALLLSLIGWILLFFKTKKMVSPLSFTVRDGYASWQFPVFVAVNAALLLFLVLTPY